MMLLLLLGIVFLANLGRISAGDITCTTEDYIRSGLEFDNCQKVALEDFNADNFTSFKQQNPCQSFKKLVDNCAIGVKHCFTPHGYQRGLRIMLESLAVNYPEVNACDILGSMSAAELTRLDEGHMCTMSQEVTLTQLVTRCNNEVQAELARSLNNEKRHKSDDPLAFSRSLLCHSLKTIRENCIEPKLNQCYAGHDYDAHLSYLLEALKVSGVVLATHLTNVTDVTECPVFADTMNFSAKKSGISAWTVVVAIVVTLAVSLSLMGAGLLAYKLRAWPRIKALLSRKPYSGFSEPRSPSRSGDPNEAAMERRISEASSNRASPFSTRDVQVF